jgi:hypothetical protein
MKKTVLVGLVSLAIVSAHAQQRTTLTSTDYGQAQRFLSTNAEQLVDHGSVRPNWLAGDRLWYRDLNASGSEFILVDPAKGTRVPAFDHQKLAGALSTVAGKTYQANRLPFQTISFTPDLTAVLFQANGKRWSCNLKTYEITPDTAPAQTPFNDGGGRPSRGSAGPAVLSPDKKRAAYIKEYNLWVRDVATGNETQLTTDGI